MKAGTLFISFWDICLENLPEGAFVRRRLTPAEAGRLIKEAQRQKRLVCVSERDLLAPYHKHDRDNHDALRRCLKNRFGISLAFRDFTSTHEADDGAVYSVLPLVCAQVQGRNRLLVVTCSYMLDKKKPRKVLAFAIAPETVAFHLIESTAAVRKGRRVRTKAR